MQEDIRGIVNLNRYGLSIKWRLTNCCNYRCSYCIRKNKIESTDRLIDDKDRVVGAMPYIIDIVNQKKEETKIEFIGGEVSLFDLKTIILKLYKETKPYLKRITFTSNFSKPVEYYNDLLELCHTLGISLSIILSFHFEFVSLDTFFSKFDKLIKYDENRLSVEMVSISHNRELVENFISKCEENNIEYKVDADFNSNDKSILITASNKSNNNGYRIDFDSHSEYCSSLRKLEQIYGDSKKINTYGFMCTLDYDYIYIDRDKHIGYSEFTKKCNTEMPIEECKLRSLNNLIICNRTCTLCGQMSVFKDKKLYHKEDAK